MKIIYYLIITAALIIQSIFSIRAQSTEGREFWLTFGRNSNTTSTSGLNLQIRIASGPQLTKGTFYFTNLGTEYEFSIDAQQVYTYNLSIAEMQAVYNTTMGVSNLSIHIITDYSVTVYVMNQAGPYLEATNILPVTAIGNNYYQISYTPSPSYLDAYAVIAIEDNTRVYHNGAPMPYQGGILNAGQVYYRTSSTDMTGAHITSDKSVAFFALNQCAQVPIGYDYCDPLIQQLAPVETWGKNFLVPVSNQGINIARVVASQNNTNVTQIGGIIRLGVPGAQTSLTNLQAGQFVELEVSVANGGCYIQSLDKPIGVCAYLPSSSFTGSGDPAQSWLPAIEQTTTRTLISPFLLDYINAHYALVSTSTATKNNTMVSIGGALPSILVGGTWVDNVAAQMSFYAMPLTNASASHFFTNSAGLVVMCYGLGGTSSYYYLAGSAMRDLAAAFYANDVHYQDFESSPICENEIEFRAEIEGLHVEPERLKWYIDGVEETSARDQETWSKTFSPGEYEIKMWVRYENDDTISMKGTLKICELAAAFYANNVHHQVLADTTFCSNDVDFYAELKGVHSDHGSLKWYINGVEEEAARDKPEWSKIFSNGEYEIKMWVRFENDETESIINTLKILKPWIKIRNYRY
ncbi:MAG: IgGFc-binding protein [Bacteroidetes bacterium]|nr:IgGFc-binding protein [Bacteroidota bacterium]MCL2303360.1 IgGFc-binding protein [Lentimicrobiaceae bacterium]